MRDNPKAYEPRSPQGQGHGQRMAAAHAKRRENARAARIQRHVRALEAEGVHVAVTAAQTPLPEHLWREYNQHGNTCHYPGCTLAKEDHQRPAVPTAPGPCGCYPSDKCEHDG